MNRKAFTILEIVVVVTVLAILIGVALPRLGGIQYQGNLAKARSELAMLQSAVEAYYINQSPHAYPATSDTVVAATLSLATPLTLKGLALHDPFGSTAVTEYRYVRSANGTYFVVASVGLDGTAATLAVSDVGVVTRDGDDLCRTNGSGC